MTTLVWHRAEDVSYRSADGQYTINQEQGYTQCEAPHPLRVSREHTGRGGYCAGGEPHLYYFWQLEGPDGQKIDAGSTLRQMKDSAQHHADHLAKILGHTP